MKKIIYLALFFVVLTGFARQNSYDYHGSATLKGVVSEIEYKISSGDVYMIYILKLDQKINVNANTEWDAKNDVIEVQLSIPSHKMLRYKNRAVQVTGELFGAINEHHRRDICIKVSDISGQ